jgi:RNA polymerase sigma-70 factor, ECF subfamily
MPSTNPTAAPETTDAELVGRVRQGEAAAFETLFARHRPTVHRRALSIVRDEAAADDIVQEAFLRLWQRADQWSGEGPLAAWLAGIATNQALMHLRTQRRRREQRFDPDRGGDPTVDALPEWLREAASQAANQAADISYEQRQRQRWLEHQVDNLGADKREVFRLVYHAEVEVRQAALQLGIPEGTVKSRLYHGRRQLAAAWNDLEHEQSTKKREEE